MSLGFPLYYRKAWLSQFERCFDSLSKALVKVEANDSVHLVLFEIDKSLYERLFESIATKNLAHKIEVIHGNIFKAFSQSQKACKVISVEHEESISGESLGLELPSNFVLDQLDADFLCTGAKRLKPKLNTIALLPIRALSTLHKDEKMEQIALIMTYPYNKDSTQQPDVFFEHMSETYTNLFSCYEYFIKNPPLRTRPSASGSEKGPWNEVLKSYLVHSEANPEVVYSDSLCVIIKDKYPKARLHLLALPRKDISYLRDLCKDDIELLQHMKQIANKCSEEVKLKHPLAEFQVGFHSVPSMNVNDVIEQLSNTGKIVIDQDQSHQFLKSALKCHKCQQEFKTIPTLKTHIDKCIS